MASTLQQEVEVLQKHMRANKVGPAMQQLLCSVGVVTLLEERVQHDD